MGPCALAAACQLHEAAGSCKKHAVFAMAMPVPYHGRVGDFDGLHSPVVPSSAYACRLLRLITRRYVGISYLLRCVPNAFLAAM